MRDNLSQSSDNHASKAFTPMQSPTFTLHLKEHECDVKDQELLKEILTKCIQERTNYRDMKPIVEN